MIAGDDFRRGLALAVKRPFRVVPFFDPGPWGGQWMKEVCGLPAEAPNYAWCFDCVPEENSLRLGFGATRVEVPALDLVFRHPGELLGEAVHARFGDEFPIRFDFLDTMGGGNLSLQVHPLTEYIQDRFGMHYTQDESYYLLDAGGGGLRVPRREGGRRPRGHAPRPAPRAGRRRLRLPGRALREPVAGEEARPLPDPGRHRPLLGEGRDGARDQRDALHLHVQAVGLGPPGPRRPAPADPHRPRRRQHPVGPDDRVGASASWSTGSSRSLPARAGARRGRGSTSASSSRRAGTGSRARCRTRPAAE